ncbi:major tail protein [Ruthenibacterium lactatiformans]|uniref:major tail protein n=1 Tax=Ruthenibacterium lactatiformans TaxID=1550024 RepID=UPI0026665D6D|nr:major tail protein [Ruthenibacterium lactatiformans]
MANGKVITGFSKPYVALYAASGGVVTYSGGMPLARGVSVELSLEEGDDNNFYADNVTAETAPGIFTGGSATLTVDGLKAAARRFVFGMPEPTSITVDGKQVEIDAFGDKMQIPYVGVGFLVRYMEDRIATYAPMVLTKTRFSTPGLSAATQEDSIDWQTEELTATLMRDDTEDHNWRKVAADQATEADAEAVLKAMLGITEGGAGA